MDILQKITEELNVKKWQVEAAVKLIDEGNTIPFIARYRKEATGTLNDEQLRTLDERLKYLRSLEEKKQSVISSIREQEKLTPELEKQIIEAQTVVAVDDLYAPYRPKRRTRASMAKERGLEPLADILREQKMSMQELLGESAKFVNDEKEVPNIEAALMGAKDILAEELSDNAEVRTYIREVTFKEGKIITSAKDEKAESVYEQYYSYEEPVAKILGHRVLAINRGEKEKFLVVKIQAPVEQIIRFLNKKLLINEVSDLAPLIGDICEDSYNRLIAPAIERDIRNELTEKAEDAAISVFGKNLEQLLMQPPIAGKTVLGWDPAFRTGCKLAVVDATGKVLDTTVIFPTAPQNKVAEAKEVLKKLIKKYNVSLISVGNGTASRESEQVIVELIKEVDTPLQYVIVNEAGASVYSASKLATEEFPNFDVGQRSATSIARRLQDPLAELVKIDPWSIGVGQYQHDMNQKKLGEALGAVVEDCVNKVGVDLNTASAPLLTYISGISKTIARNIVDYREQNGKFTSRQQLLKVAKLGPKAYEQCAGFLRIHDGDNPLDDTSVHPESYDATRKLMDSMGFSMDDVREAQKKAAQKVSPSNVHKQAAIKQQEERKAQKNNRQAKKERVFIKNTNTAMGAALAAAFGNGFVSEKASNDKNEKNSLQAENVNVKETSSSGSLSSKITDYEKLASELGIGEITLRDIVSELEKPSRDPRESMPTPILRSDVMDMKDLKPGMILKGTVRNIVDFGAFVDIGVHQDGLVHISQITDRFIKHPLEAVSVGDIVDVQVLEVEEKKQRISLTMKIKK